MLCIVDFPGPSYIHEGTKICPCRRGHSGGYRWQLQGRGPVYILVIHRLVVISTEPMVLAASRTTRVDLRTWSHIICGINDTNRAFRKVEITCILVANTSLGILMTRSLSGVRVNPLQRSTAESWVVFILWMGAGSSRRLIAHIIHRCSTERLAFMKLWGGSTFIEVRVQAVRLKLRPRPAVRLTLAL